MRQRYAPGDRVVDRHGNRFTVYLGTPDEKGYIVGQNAVGSYVLINPSVVSPWECNHDDLEFELELDESDVMLTLTCRKCGEVREGSIAFGDMVVIGEQP